MIYPVTDDMAAKLSREIKQTRPFGSPAEEAMLALLRTADQVVAPVNEVLRAANLSHSQYNVLRILRGAGDEGLPCGEISDRMVRRDPDVTRLIDRLDSRGLVTRSRGTADRRVVNVTITPEGLAILAELDAPVAQSVRDAFANVDQERLAALIETLDQVRGG